MSKIEHILQKAHKKGIYDETMSLAQNIKNENPKIEITDRYELAYEKAKKYKNKKIKAAFYKRIA
jgi:spore coat polysaccharide biosynthesis predicted glycosyltransferase SpsG